jgi:EAL domain-containing protein (putative c-di-GMP-specific phosphodiesterase class I)
MERLKSIGISLALDDFGTGYSSLSCLTAFPFDKIKIDRSFIGNLTKRHKSSAIISSIVTLARGLNLSVTAEGVETQEQFERLKTLGVNFAQGYLLGRPVPLGEPKVASIAAPWRRDERRGQSAPAYFLTQITRTTDAFASDDPSAAFTALALRNSRTASADTSVA